MIALSPQHEAQAARLMSRLMSGQRNAISGPDLAASIGVSKSVLPLYIRWLRQEGMPIASEHQGGYWLADRAEELESTVDQLRRKRRGIDEMLAILARTQELLPA